MQTTTSGRPGSWFYTLIGVTVFAIALVGFSRTYYLRPWFQPQPLTWRLHLHGFAQTLWLVLFVTQGTLVATGRRRLHRALGVAGVALAAVATIATYLAATEAARLPARGALTSVDRLYSSVVILVLFAAFVALGTAFRRRPELHKRCMLLATISVVGPAVTRAVALAVGHGIRDAHVPVMACLVLAAVAYDWWNRGRPHWVLLCGGGLLLASQVTRRWIGGSEAWAALGTWLIG